MPETEDHVAYLCEVMRYLIAGDDVATMIDKQETGNADFRAAQARFLTHAQEAINPRWPRPTCARC
jgi:TorA maturation chaperone TorD